MTRKDLLARSWFWASLIGLTAFSLRLIYFFQLKSTVYFHHLQIDSLYYWEWAGRIAKGEILGDAVFDMSPLYPYLLGIYRYFLGESFTPLYLLQIGLGTGTALILFLLARRLYGLQVGVIAGFILAVYKPAIMFDVMVMKSFLTPLLLVGMAYFLVVSSRYGTVLAAGLLLSLSASNDGSYLLLTPFVLHWLFWQHDKARGGKLVLTFLLGMLVAFTPIIVRNYLVSGEFTLSRAGGGYVFYIGCLPEFQGEYHSPDFVPANPLGELTAFPEEARKRTGNPHLSIKEASNYWFREGLKLIKAQPLVYLQNVGRRLMILWNAYEWPDNYNYQFLQRLIPFLGWPLLDFVTIGGLGLWGLSLQIYRERRLNLIFLIVLGGAVSLLPFIVFDRLRLGMIPFVIIAAAWGVVELAKILVRQDKKAKIIAIVTLALALLFVNYPLKINRKHLLSVAYNNLALIYFQTNQPLQALDYYLTALRTNHTNLTTHQQLKSFLVDQNILDGYSGEHDKFRQASREIVEIYFEEGDKALTAGNGSKARYFYNLARDFEPENPRALRGIELATPVKNR